MLLTCDQCGVTVHAAWEFCRRCGVELPTFAPAEDPRMLPALDLDRLRPEMRLRLATRTLRRRWRPVNSRLASTIDGWRRRLRE